ncbi:conserved hypothetical protein [Methanoregula boonei 6A8]|jgi:hypothetical protein|uniref:DUF5350 family protein n=1 Tax=Methanoregula boonei (strain DSM 21154 / JCM 14090 / 6A8) TaxID=456442 RepID=A7I8W8_METB6|nr:DUF5350 domain-containing protein [Methanoregula boonei]ABS56179.1 conserved hypothetical protein [Methanoregula boonei 6A8]
MGKTGTTLWSQVKGVKGQIRLVPKKEGERKSPGPNQRFKSSINLKKIDQAAAEEQRGGRGGGARRGGRGGRRGGDRSGGSGMNESTASPLIRRRMRRAKVSALGAKAKSGK